MDEIHMTANQFGERRFGAVFSVGAQQLRVGLIVHSPDSSRHRQNRTGKGKIHFDGAQFRRDIAAKAL